MYSTYPLHRHLASSINVPLTASGLYMEPRSLRNSSYIGCDCSPFMASWKSGLLPLST